MKGVKIGKKRHLIQIQEDQGTQAADGSNVPNWVTVFADRLASIEPLTSREVLQAAQLQPDTTHKIGIRHEAGIHAAMRILFGTRIFHFAGPPIDTEELNRELIILAKEEETTT